MKEAELPNLWDNPDMKLMSWCFNYLGLFCLFWMWDLWYFSTAHASGHRAERGEQGALFGNCFGFVCIKVVSLRGSGQEYRQGMLSTMSTHLPRGRARCRHRNRLAAPVVFCQFWFFAMCYCKDMFGFCHSLTPDTLSWDALLSRSPWATKDVGEMTVSVPVAITCSSWCLNWES